MQVYKPGCIGVSPRCGHSVQQNNQSRRRKETVGMRTDLSKFGKRGDETMKTEQTIPLYQKDHDWFEIKVLSDSAIKVVNDQSKIDD